MARIDDYKESFRLAVQDLKKANLHRLARLAGAEIAVPHDGAPQIRLSFLQTPVLITAGENVTVTKESSEGGGELSLPESILILHYLLHANDAASTGRLVTFREIPDGQFYYDAFQRRARDPFLATFGRDAELFGRCARALGGEPVEAGDVGMTFRVFPRISIRLALWVGDDEFPPEASVLFEDNIERLLPVEDVAVLSGLLVYRLMGIARSMSSGS